MTPARLLLDIWLVLVVLSLAGVAGISISWILISAATLATATRRHRREPDRLGSLRGRFDESDLADMLYQQFNATVGYAAIDDRLNSALGFPHYPNPAAYLGIIALFAALTAAVAWGIGALSARRDVKLTTSGQFMDRTSRFRRYFVPIAYGLIPVVGADYFARQLPKFFQHATRVIPSVQHLVGAAGARSPLYSAALLSDPRIITAQLVVVGLGTVGSLWATWRIANRELVPVSRSATGVRVAALSLVLVCGIVAAWLYVLINAAD